MLILKAAVSAHVNCEPCIARPCAPRPVPHAFLTCTIAFCPYIFVLARSWNENACAATCHVTTPSGRAANDWDHNVSPAHPWLLFESADAADGGADWDREKGGQARRRDGRIGRTTGRIMTSSRVIVLTWRTVTPHLRPAAATRYQNKPIRTDKSNSLAASLDLHNDFKE